MSAFAAQALGGIVIAVITVGGSWLVAKASNRTSQRNTERNVAGQIESSRLQAEQNAYERAEATMGRTIDRLTTEVGELEADIAQLKERVTELERSLADSHSERDHLRDQLAATRAELEQAYRSMAGLRAELAAAKVLLERAYPDEP